MYKMVAFLMSFCMGQQHMLSAQSFSDQLMKLKLRIHHQFLTPLPLRLAAHMP